MIICKTLVIAIFLHVASTYLSKHDRFSYDVENAKKRYSRDANPPSTIIREKLFERKTATTKSVKIIKTSGKLK